MAWRRSGARCGGPHSPGRAPSAPSLAALRALRGKIPVPRPGLAAEARSFDPWGLARNPDWTPAPGGAALLETPRGFTGHEHIQTVGLIHMNGRVYDPALGRMLSADPFVQDPTFTQSFNRYSYVINNPLSFTDPSGFQADPDLENYRDTHGDSRPDPKDPRGDLGDRNYDGGGEGGYGGSDGTGSGIDMESRGFVQTGTTFTDDYETREFWAGMGGELSNMAFDFVYMVNITINPYVLVAGLYLYPDPPFDTMGPDASTARQAGAWTAIALSAGTPFGKRHAAIRAVNLYRGGAFGRLVKRGAGLERHHMPADSISPFGRLEGPAIQMEIVDHALTSSYRSSASAVAYRAELKALIDQGRIREAIVMEIKDIRQIAGTKYNSAMLEMLDYAKEAGLY